MLYVQGWNWNFRSKERFIKFPPDHDSAQYMQMAEINCKFFICNAAIIPIFFSLAAIQQNFVVVKLVTYSLQDITINLSQLLLAVREIWQLKCSVVWHSYLNGSATPIQMKNTHKAICFQTACSWIEPVILACKDNEIVFTD